jgi:hypothetical protein
VLILETLKDFLALKRRRHDFNRSPSSAAEGPPAIRQRRNEVNIWKLEINEVQPDPPIISSSYRAPRHKRRTEYFASIEGAESRQLEVYEGAQKLFGLPHGVEVVITKLEVNP